MGENPFFLICFYHFKIETEKQMKRRYPQSNPCLKHSKKFKCVIGARGRECLLIVRKTAVIVRTVPHDSMRRPLRSKSRRIRERRMRRRQRRQHSPLPLWCLRFLQVVAQLCRLNQTIKWNAIRSVPP